MPTFDILDAEAIFEKLIARVEAGEEIGLARGGQIVAILTPFSRVDDQEN